MVCVMASRPKEKRKRKGAGLRPVVLKKAAGGEKYPGQERLGAGFGDRPTDIDVGQEVGAVEVGDGGDKAKAMSTAKDVQNKRVHAHAGGDYEAAMTAMKAW